MDAVRPVNNYTQHYMDKFFNQYLRDTRIPTLEYKIENAQLKFRYTNIVEDFDMPIEVEIDGKHEWIFPNSEWKTKPNNFVSHHHQKIYP